MTWSGLEEILKGVQSPLENAYGPSTALRDQMKTIGKIDQDVTVLDEKCQVLDVSWWIVCWRNDRSF